MSNSNISLKQPPNRSYLMLASLLAFLLFFPTMTTYCYFMLAQDWNPTVQKTLFGIGKILQFGFPAAWVYWHIEARPQIKWPNKRELFQGVAFGLAMLLIMVFGFHYVMIPYGLFDVAKEQILAKVNGLGLGTTGFILVGIFYSLVHSLMEEYYWRWFTFGELEKVFSSTVAIFVSALGFMSHHVLVIGFYFGFGHWATWFFSFCVAVGGAVWAWQYKKSGSLVGPWLGHLLIDAGIFYCGYQLLLHYQ